MNNSNRSKLKKMLRAGNRGDIARLSDDGWAEVAQDNDASDLWRRLRRAGYVYMAGGYYLLAREI